MGLHADIVASGMAPELAFAFLLGLESMSGEDELSIPVRRFLDQSLGPIIGACSSPAPFEDLWPYAEIFLQAAIVLSVANGAYGLAQTRRVGEMAARLKVSAADLSRIEARVFDELRAGCGTSPPDEDDPSERTDVALPRLG